MSEIIENTLKENKGKRAIFFLKNGFRYEGIIKDFDEDYLELFDYRIKGTKIIEIQDIKEISVYGVEK